jgi:hypothetical protein
MSTKHLTATLATALALSAVSVTAAQAHPTGIDISKSAGKVASGPSAPVVQGPLGRSHIAYNGTLISTAPTLGATKQSGAGGYSLTLFAELAGLVLLGTALIAVWFAARSRAVRPLPY